LGFAGTSFRVEDGRDSVAEWLVLAIFEEGFGV
jgi:hypothetical protein